MRQYSTVEHMSETILLSSSTNDLLALTLLATKQKAWRFEMEWTLRLPMPRISEPKSKVNSFSSSRKIISYLDIIVHGGVFIQKLDSKIFSPNCTNNINKVTSTNDRSITPNVIFQSSLYQLFPLICPPDLHKNMKKLSLICQECIFCVAKAS